MNCDSVKSDWLQGVHQPGDVYMMALYVEGSGMSVVATHYTPKGETSGQGYNAGGTVLIGTKYGASAGRSWLSFDDAKWTNATFSARYALIYNATKQNKAVAMFDFGEKVSSTNAPFKVSFPAATAETAAIRIF